MRTKLFILLVILSFSSITYAKSPVVLMTDFGLQDGAVSAMKGVILDVDPSIVIADLTHNIEPFNIPEAAYRLQQVMEYYPKGTVFVCVIDPGVGTKRKSVVAKLNNGYFFVGPDNGILTYVAKTYGIAEVREIDENTNRLTHSNSFYNTFHGRDVFALTGAKLASDKISLNEVGKTSDAFIKFKVTPPVLEKNSILGTIMVLDSIYGNLWTDIDYNLAERGGFTVGKSAVLEIYSADKLMYSSRLRFVKTFGEAKNKESLIYINSMGNLSVAINCGNFSKKFNIKPGYKVKIRLLTSR